MYCPSCGATNDDTARFCTTCGQNLDEYRKQWRESSGRDEQQTHKQAYQPYSPPPLQTPPYRTDPYSVEQPHGVLPRIPSYMGWAIAVLILCFWPTGIVAVVYASRVGERLALGDIAGAQEASRKARMWCWISFAIAVAGLVLSLAIGFALLPLAALDTVY